LTYGGLSPRAREQRAARKSAPHARLRRRLAAAVARGAAVDRAGARVLRGGSWNNHANNCRAANRSELAPATAVHFVGLRLAWSVPEVRAAR